MESRWLLFPGQTLSNTKISDRHHALHIKEKNWSDIKAHLDRKRNTQAALDKEESWKSYLKDGSMKMMENWQNSLENIRKKKEEDKLKTLAQKTDDRMQRFFEIRKEQEQIRAAYIDKVNKQIYRSTGYAKDLTSAFVQSEVHYEREKQKEFNEFLKKHDVEEEFKYAEMVKENARKEAEEKKEQLLKKYAKEREYGEYLKSVIHSKREKEEQLKDKKVKKEAMDNILAAKEMECLKKAEEEEKAKHKQELYVERMKVQRASEAKQWQKEKEEKEMNDVIQIYQETKHRIDCMKKERIKEIRAAQVARRDAVAQMVSAEQEAKDEEEERQLKKAIAERESAEEARLLEKLELRDKMRKDRLEDRRRCLERFEKQKEKETKLKNWEMLNRFKTDEVMTKYDGNAKMEHWKKVLEYRKELLEQMDENKEEAEKERELERIIAATDLSSSEADKKFFAYANEVMEHAKKKGRPTYPIEKVITEYKKLYSLDMNPDKTLQDEECKTSSSTNVKKKYPKKRLCRCNVKK